MTDQPLLIRYQDARVLAVLPGAGAYDTTALVLECPDAEFVSLYFTYTRGAAGGAFNWKIERSPEGTPTGTDTEWYQESHGDRPAVVAGTDNTGVTQQADDGYETAGAAAERFVVGPVELEGTAERLRVFAQETGVVGTPGTLEITAVFG